MCKSLLQYLVLRTVVWGGSFSVDDECLGVNECFGVFIADVYVGVREIVEDVLITVSVEST